MGRRKYSEEDLARITQVVRHRTVEAVLAADPDQREAGLGWYSVAHEEAKMLAMSREDVAFWQAVEIIAVLSPLTRWAQTLGDAWAVVSGDDTQHALPENVKKAKRILAGEHGVLGGRKVNSFGLNIFNPRGDGVTCDSWMGRCWGIDPSDIFSRFGVYDACVKGVRQAAIDLNMRPNQAQAIAWLVTIDDHWRGREYVDANFGDPNLEVI